MEQSRYSDALCGNVLAVFGEGQDFLTVLDSERTLFQNQDQLAQSQVSVITNLISLYKALGGGWQVMP